MERHLTKGVASMALFTNRKHQDAHTDLVNSGLAIEALNPSFHVVEASAFDGADLDPAEPEERRASSATSANAHQAEPFGAGEASSIDSPEGSGQSAEAELAEVGITLAEVEPNFPPAPRRTWNEPSPDEQPADSARASTLGIDVDGLLQLLGVTADASLKDISQARLQFLWEHDPSGETNQDAAKIKERICREVNTAYASFRLTRAG